MAETKPPIAPIMGACGCLGHVRTTAKGFVAHDANDQPIGIFASAGAAAAAVLTST